MTTCTPSQLKAIVPNLSLDRAIGLAAGLNAAAEYIGANTRLRLAAFIAQWAHESAGFRYLEEIWGPTDAQRRYEGRTDLGNFRPGDGYKFRGRGWCQLTGRANYRLAGDALKLDLEGNPDQAAQPDIAWRVAAWYWQRHGLNALADAGDFEGITRRINGGYNGLADRKRYYQRALDVLVEETPRVILINKVGQEEPWDGKATTYSGMPFGPALVAILRQLYPLAGGPWVYQSLKVWVRRNGDMVIERA